LWRTEDIWCTERAKSCTEWLTNVVVCPFPLQVAPTDSAGWLLNRDMDVLIVKHLRENEKKPLRLVSRAAKAVVDMTVNCVRIQPGSDLSDLTLRLNRTWDLHTIEVVLQRHHLVSEVSGYLESLAKLPMKHLRHFTFVGLPMFVEHLEPLATAPWLGHLETLRLDVRKAKSRHLNSHC
jgi:hypothetical protein